MKDHILFIHIPVRRMARLAFTYAPAAAEADVGMLLSIPMFLCLYLLGRWTSGFFPHFGYCA